MRKQISNINKYTLIEIGKKVNRIYFYPEQALLKERVRTKKKQATILFELYKEKEDGIYLFYVNLLDREGNNLFRSYSLYLEEIEKYKYIILKRKEYKKHANTLKGEIINFNELDYNKFLEILKNNSELRKMIPYLKKALKKENEDIKNIKKIASHISINKPNIYYHNVLGSLIDKIIKAATSDNELEISDNILKNIKKNLKVILNNKNEMDLAYATIYSKIVNALKIETIKPVDTLTKAKLKVDTNREEMSYKELLKIIDNYYNNKPNDNNIVAERIEFIINLRPNAESISNYLKVIIANEKYIDDNKKDRSRHIKEDALKELIIKTLNSSNYIPLPRNQVLLYNKRNEKIDFVAIITTDLIVTLLDTYRFNRLDELKEARDLAKTISNIILKNQTKENLNTLKIDILTLINILIYNYKNIYDESLLFDKSKYLIDLDYKDGKCEIKIIDRDTEKKYGRLNNIDEETNQAINKSLNRGEKSFNRLINKIIYESIENSLNSLKCNIKINDVSLKKITVQIQKGQKANYYTSNFTLEELLNIITTIKIKREKIVLEEPKEEKIEEPTPKQNNEERDYVIRKVLSIVDIMSKKPLDNQNYKKVVELYEEYQKSEKERKEEILNELKKLI